MFRIKRDAEGWARRTEDDMVQYRDEHLAGDVGADGKRHPRNNNVVRIELVPLRHLFTLALKEWGLGLTYNPVESIQRPTLGAGRDRRQSRTEEKRLLKAVDAHSAPLLGWIIRLAPETGMRSSEIISLTRTQVDFSRRVIRLQQLNKGNARTVPLTHEATRVLREALNHPIRSINTDLVFFGEPDRNGKYHRYQFDLTWLNTKCSCDLSDLHFHDLRHEAVNQLVEARLSEQEVTAISGHKFLQMLKRCACALRTQLESWTRPAKEPQPETTVTSECPYGPHLDTVGIRVSAYKSGRWHKCVRAAQTWWARASILTAGSCWRFRGSCNLDCYPEM